ncbi:MAG: hypothetical protein V7638_3449 [Acidobacteriota bacterium]
MLLLSDPDPTVRTNALNALLRSPEPLSWQVVNRAFAQAKGDTAISLIPLLLEQENATLSATLGKDFARRSEGERLAIMTAVAGRNDSNAIELIKSGLNDPAPAVQRVALMRLLALPADISTPAIDNYLRLARGKLQSFAKAVKSEIETRQLWSFLKRTAAAAESIFPSQNGTTPMTSPDGQWVAYVETGWGRPGGTGGFGRSNLISITHVVRNNGTQDGVVSDMFLVSWMSDSKRVGTARDAFVAISDLDGNVLTEFGEARDRTNDAPGSAWTKTDLRSQFGGSRGYCPRLLSCQEGRPPNFHPVKKSEVLLPPHQMLTALLHFQVRQKPTLVRHARMLSATHLLDHGFHRHLDSQILPSLTF